MSNLPARLMELLAAYPVAGVAVLRPDRAIEAGWDVVTRADGLVVRLDWAAGAADAQKAAARAAVLAADLAAADAQVLRAAADALLSSDAGGAAKAVRAVALAGEDEVNSLRSWLTSFVAQVALATSLQNLQSRVAALPALPARTKQQLLNAATGRVDDGSSD